jgi:hypothetical protein
MVRREGYWVKHSNKELQELLIELDDAGWFITRRKGYYIVRCPDGCHSQKTVHLTPSNRYYGKNLRKFLVRNTCFGKQTDGREEHE